MVFLIGSVFVFLVYGIAGIIITLPITIPLVIFFHLYEYLEYGSEYRKFKIANNKARREYIKSLSPYDRKAYLWYEKQWHDEIRSTPGYKGKWCKFQTPNRFVQQYIAQYYPKEKIDS